MLSQEGRDTRDQRREPTEQGGSSPCLRVPHPQPLSRGRGEPEGSAFAQLSTLNPQPAPSGHPPSAIRHPLATAHWPVDESPSPSAGA